MIRFLIFILLIFSFTFANDIIIGVRADKGKVVAIKEWQATIDYLNEKIDGYNFKLLPLVKYELIKEKIKDKKIDFLISDPILYVEVEYLYGVTRLATLQRKKGGFYFDKFGSVIFTRSDRDDINSFKDFDDKLFMGISPNAFAGDRVAYREMLLEGYNPKKMFKNILYSGGRGDYVIERVLRGEADIGSVRTGLIEYMIKQNRVIPEEIKIINQKKYDCFPFLCSTKLYPEFPFSKLAHIDEKLAKQVLLALLSINENSLAAISGKYARWLIPNEYTEISELMKMLKVGIYKDYGEITLSLVFQKYWQIILITFIFIIILLILLYKIKKQSFELEKLSITDTLTGLNNRLKINQVLEEEFERTKRYGEKFSVILMDIDYFKNINDTYGHQIGDEVLKKMARILMNNIRISDVVCRWGGEEFLIVCLNSDLYLTIKIAQKIRVIVEKELIYKELKITSSFGVTECESNDVNWLEIVARADKALYKAKDRGRNRVEYSV